MTAEFDTIRLRELAKAATSGPWHRWPETNDVCERAQHTIVASCPGKDGDKRWEWGTVHHPEADAEFIAALNPEIVISLLDRIEELEREVTVWRSGGVYVSKADWDEEDLTGGLLSAEGRQRFAEMTEKPPQPGAAQRRIDKLEDELRERRRK